MRVESGEVLQITSSIVYINNEVIKMAVYATTDLHGNKALYDKIKVMLEPEDIVYFLGDANDRGPDGWELIKTIYEDPQFIYLRGNHECMFVAAALDCLAGKDRSENVMFLYRNGGAKTLSAWKREGKSKRWLEKIVKLPTHTEYINQDGKVILMSHAGYTPQWIDDKLYIPNDVDLLWEGDHIDDYWNETHFGDCVVVHGHTPTFYIAAECGHLGNELDAGAYWYCNNHKVGLDNACYTTGFACLLNLDTLEDIVISID